MIDRQYQDPEPRYPSGWVFTGAFIAVVVMLVGLFTGDLLSYFDAIVIAMIGLIVVGSIGRRMATPADADWLPGMIAAAYIAKMFFSLARYLVMWVVYGGGGDAIGYHGAGNELSEYWRAFQLPPDIDIGTKFTEAIAGLVYTPYAPSMLGGFFLFATLAFFGQMLLYAAFRNSITPRRPKWYCYPLFFFPAVGYWPASLGKESLMFLGIGLAAYGSSALMRRGGIRPILIIAAGLAFAGAIRPHVSALILASLALTLVLARSRTGLGLSPGMKLLAVLVIGAGSVFLVSFAAANFNIDLSGDVGAEVDAFVTNIEGNTTKGGSSVEGGAVSGPQDIPGAALKVLFRPLPYEAHNMQAMASALESSVFLLIILWRSPKIIRNMRTLRSDPYVLFSLIMTFGFVIMFSPFLNLGLMARERSMILPFLAVLVIQLGWDHVRKEEEEAPPGDNRRIAAPIPA
ncbi:MAG: hypothetical protein ACFCU2_13295 [Acidimicrobiia bacterium]